MFMFADAIADGGVKMGLTRDMALKLSFQLVAFIYSKYKFLLNSIYFYDSNSKFFILFS